MRYRLQRHEGTDCSATMVPFTVLRMVPIQRYRHYIQATYQLPDETTRQREFGNLLAIRNSYPKYVVSLDEWTSGSITEGIQHLHLAAFLQMEL